jgi:hypothetical protein
MALDVEDFEPAKGTIAITTIWDHTHRLGPPKSRHSVRTIRVPANVFPILRAAAGNRKMVRCSPVDRGTGGSYPRSGRHGEERAVISTSSSGRFTSFVTV